MYNYLTYMSIKLTGIYNTIYVKSFFVISMLYICLWNVLYKMILLTFLLIY